MLLKKVTTTWQGSNQVLTSQPEVDFPGRQITFLTCWTGKGSGKCANLIKKTWPGQAKFESCLSHLGPVWELLWEMLEIQEKQNQHCSMR